MPTDRSRFTCLFPCFTVWLLRYDCSWPFQESRHDPCSQVSCRNKEPTCWCCLCSIAIGKITCSTLAGATHNEWRKCIKHQTLRSTKHFSIMQHGRTCFDPVFFASREIQLSSYNSTLNNFNVPQNMDSDDPGPLGSSKDPNIGSWEVHQPQPPYRSVFLGWKPNYIEWKIPSFNNPKHVSIHRKCCPKLAPIPSALTRSWVVLLRCNVFTARAATPVRLVLTVARHSSSSTEGYPSGKWSFTSDR